MKIVLVNPNQYLEDLIHPPIGLALLATICSELGHDVQVLDLPILRWTDRQAAEAIEKFGPELVGFTVTTKIYAGAVEIARLVKTKMPQVRTVMGGPHATFAARTVLERCPDIDFTILFEGEFSLPKLIDELRNPNRWDTVPGLGYRDNGTIVVTPQADPIESLDALPTPRRDFFPMDLYLARDDETTLLTARGCPNRCAFCSTSRMGRRLRMRSPENVLQELRLLLDMGFKSIFFSDDTLTSSTDRVRGLCSVFRSIDRDWRWTCNMRLQDARPEILKPMKEAGCYRTFVGVESSSTQILGRINKRCPADQAVDLCKLIQETGIEVHASFLLGLPGETRDTIDRTVECARKMNPDMISFNILTPYPGTELYETPEEYGIVMPDRFWFEKSDWFSKPVCGTQAISPEELKSLVKEAYVAFLD